jgi:hypothetical protein
MAEAVAPDFIADVSDDFDVSDFIWPLDELVLEADGLDELGLEAAGGEELAPDDEGLEDCARADESINPPSAVVTNNVLSIEFSSIGMWCQVW